MNTSSRFVATALATVIAAVALGSAQPSLATELKIATSAPDGTAWMMILRQAGKDVASTTEQRVTLKFYPGGTQGDDRDVMRKMRIGQLHGGSIRTGVFGRTYSDIQLYNLPMVFRSMDEVDAVRRALDQDLIDGLGEAGYTAYGIVELGMAYAMSTREARSLVDARRLKVWAPKGDIPAIRLLEAFDIEPITLTIGEVLPSLTSGGHQHGCGTAGGRAAAAMAHTARILARSAVHVHLQSVRHL